MKSKNIALVILSGGQDSVTCLGLALTQYEHVEAISFTYGSRHQGPEMECAKQVCLKHNVPRKVVDLGFLKDLVTSALVGDGEVGKPHAYKPGLPSSFVPGRNAMFLTVAHAHAQEIDAKVIITGVCETDFSGYPDCRNTFIKALIASLNIGYETDIKIETPLMWLDKAATFALAEKIGFLPEVLNMSHTCYNGDHHTRHEWGFGCGDCPACDLREKGFIKFLQEKGTLPID